jgi:hypothetical protein
MMFFAAMPQRAALVWSLLTGYLLLPESFAIDLPGLPAVDKVSVLAVSLVLALMLIRPATGKGAPPPAPALETQERWMGRIIYLLLAMVVINAGMTVATNREPVVYPTMVQPPVSSWDLVSTLSATLFMIVPFFLGRRYLATAEDHRYLLRCLLLAGLAYSLLILYEIRMGPTLHSDIYGMSQHSFRQHVRDGQFRPKVFLRHGLWVGLFLFSVVLAGTALARAGSEAKRLFRILATLWMLGILLISKNLGAVMITCLLLPLLWLPVRTILTASAVIAVIFVTYPALRQADMVPLDRVLSVAYRISPERATSFEFRLRNEDILLARAAEKPLSGWGGWGRAQPSDDRGNRITTVDGLWVGTLGSSGWIGYVSFFGLLVFPILALFHIRKRREIPLETAALSLIMAGNLLYLIPNSALSPIGWLMVGAIAGFVQYGTKASEPAPQTPAGNSREIRYTRFGARQPRPGATLSPVNGAPPSGR